MKQLDDAIGEFIRSRPGAYPDIAYIGDLQIEMLQASQVEYNRKAELIYRGLRLIPVKLSDYLHVTEAPGS